MILHCGSTSSVCSADSDTNEPEEADERDRLLVNSMAHLDR